MPQKVRLAWAAGLSMVVIAVGALLFAVTSHPAYPPLPNPNGYDDFVKAGRSIGGDITGIANLDREALRGLVASNAEPLRVLRQGLRRQCVFPTAAGITNLSGSMSDLANLKKLSLLLKAQGQLAELNGRPAEAATNYLEILQLAHQTSHGGFVINVLITVACAAIGEIPLAKLLPSLSCEQARPLLAELDQLDRNRVSFEEIQRNESRLMFHEMLDKNPIQWPTMWLEVHQLLPHTQSRYNMGIARERLLMVELALRCFRSSHGTAPTQLQELVPAYLNRLPADPFTKIPLIYKSQGTNWLLYSVGPDGVDDGGKSVQGHSLSPKGDLLYDSPW